MKKIACFHLFNDYSGSPKVLKNVIEGLLEKGYSVDLITSRGGVLDELAGKEGLRMRQYSYRFAGNVALRLMRYLWVQLHTFFTALGYVFRKDTVVYINTILPIGAAIGGKLAGKKVVYHYHENAQAKSTAYRVLARAMQCIAHSIVCVSGYQRQFVKRKRRVYVIPNALPKEFVQKLQPHPERAFAEKRILMLGSLKDYKGTREFIGLARELQEYSFELVINDTQDAIEGYIKRNGIEVPHNITIHPRQENVALFYNRASLVLNLSDKNRFIETFGLTALEAMSAGLPVIVPTVGGIAEMVIDGVNGYRIDVQEMGRIKENVQNILEKRDLYLTLCNNSVEYSKTHSARQMIDNLEGLLA